MQAASPACSRISRERGLSAEVSIRSGRGPAPPRGGCAGHLFAVHPRHLMVEDHEAVRVPFHLSLPEFGQDLRRVAEQRGRNAHRVSWSCRIVRFVTLSSTVRTRRRARFADREPRPPGVGGRLQRDPEPEGRAAPRLAVDVDAAPHELRQLPADREPQPGPAVLAGRGGVRLHEGEKSRSFCGGVRPIPVSRTEKRISPLSSQATWMLTSPCSVNLRALLTRLMSICRIRSGSPWASRGLPGGRGRSARSLCPAPCGRTSR